MSMSAAAALIAKPAMGAPADGLPRPPGHRLWLVLLGFCPMLAATAAAVMFMDQVQGLSTLGYLGLVAVNVAA